MSSSPKLDCILPGLDSSTGDHAEAAESLGFDGVWTPEVDRDAFMPLPVVADHTGEVELGTRIATAFTRSPMVLAQQAWDLQRVSDGRFVLGLGTQVKAHNERRFSVEWGQPTQRLREVVESVRHIWRYWQGEIEEFGYDGEFYSFSLMTTAFNPGSVEGGLPPVYLAAVNEGNVRLAGELADGVCVHPFCTPRYLEERMVPWLEESAEEHGRGLDDVTVSASPFVVTGTSEKQMTARREMARMRVAFYASTPAYKPVMQLHGWEDVGRRLWELSREGDWTAMAGLVDDEMLAEFAVEASPEDVADAVLDRWGGHVDRVALDVDEGFTGQEFWRDVVDGW